MRVNAVLRAALCTAGMLLLPIAASADPITVTFDDRPAAAQAPLAYLARALIGFSAFGSFPEPLSFYGGWAIGANSAATTPPQVGFGSATGTPDSGHPHFVGLFAVPGNSENEAKTSFVSFHVVGTEAGQTSPWTAAIFGERVNLLATQMGTTDALVTFSHRGIHRLVLYSSPGLEAIDNLTFETPVVPEPTTMLLVGSGLGALAVRRLRRRHA